MQAYITAIFSHTVIRQTREESMGKGFICSMIAGVLAGAIVVANSYKARKLVKDGQECVKQKVSEMTEKADKKKSDNYEELD